MFKYGGSIARENPKVLQICLEWGRSFQSVLWSLSSVTYIYIYAYYMYRAALFADEIAGNKKTKKYSCIRRWDVLSVVTGTPCGEQGKRIGAQARVSVVVYIPKIRLLPSSHEMPRPFLLY